MMRSYISAIVFVSVRQVVDDLASPMKSTSKQRTKIGAHATYAVAAANFDCRSAISRLDADLNWYCIREITYISAELHKYSIITCLTSSAQRALDSSSLAFNVSISFI